MTERRRKDDPVIQEIREDVKNILRVLNGNGDIGLCASVKINADHIEELKKKPSAVRNWLVGAAILINTLVAGLALYKGVL